MTDRELPNPELDALRGEIEGLRKEIADERVERAAKHVELMRNWLGVYTLIVSALLVGFAALGWRGLSDIDANKARVEAVASKAEVTLGKVDATAEKVEAAAGTTSTLVGQADAGFRRFSAEEEAFNAAVKENETVVRQNKAVLSGFRSSLGELESKQHEVAARQDDLQQKLTKLDTGLQKASSSISSSVTLTSGIGGIVSNSLNVPVITSVFSSAVTGIYTIGGFGFGSSPGRLLVRVVASNTLLTYQDLEAQSGSAEVPRALIEAWGDNTIICRESQTQKLPPRGNSDSLLMQVITSSGTRSNVYSVLPPPSAPLLLNAAPQ